MTRPRRRLVRCALAACLVALALALTGCAGALRTHANTPATGRIVIFAKDASCDEPARASASARQALALGVQAAAGDQGTLVAGTFSTRVYQRGDAFAVTDFTSDKKNERGVRRDLTLQARRYLQGQEAARLLAGPRRGQACGTDLLHVLATLAHEVAPLAGAGRRPLDAVILTNGLEIDRAAGIDFVHQDLGPAARRALVRRIRAQGFLPRLSGWRLHWVGIGIERRVSAARKLELERFYGELTRAAGARPSLIDGGDQLVLARVVS